MLLSKREIAESNPLNQEKNYYNSYTIQKRTADTIKFHKKYH